MRRGRSQAVSFAIATIVLASAVVALTVTSNDGGGSVVGSPRGSARSQPSSGIWVVDIANSRVIRTIPLRGMQNVFVGGGHAWAGDTHGIVEMDAATGAQQGRIPVAGGATWVGFVAGSVWTAPPPGPDYYIDAILRVNVATRQVTRIAVPHSYPAPYAGAGAIWVPGDRKISRIDAATGRVTGTLPFGLAQPNLGCAVTFTPNALWIASAVRPNPDMLIRVNPRSDRVGRRIPIPFSGSNGYCVTAGAGVLWVAGKGSIVWEIDPRTGRHIGTLHVGHGIWLAGTPSALWISSSDDPKAVHEVNASRITIARVKLPFQPLGFQATGDTLWAPFVKGT